MNLGVCIPYGGGGGEGGINEFGCVYSIWGEVLVNKGINSKYRRRRT